jgi:hypothetical protein
LLAGKVWLHIGLGDRGQNWANSQPQKAPSEFDGFMLSIDLDYGQWLIPSIVVGAVHDATVRGSFTGHLSKARERLVGFRIVAQTFGFNLE